MLVAEEIPQQTLVDLLRVAAQPHQVPSPLIVLDLDGTLFDVREGEVVDFNDPDSVERGLVPHDALCNLLRRSVELRFAYLTARPNAVRAVTQRQLKAAGLPMGPVVMQSAYQGHEAIVPFKARSLGEIARVCGKPVALFVGDDETDALAAREAGVDFLPALSLRYFAEQLRDVGDHRGIPAGAVAFGAAAIRLLARPVPRKGTL